MDGVGVVIQINAIVALFEICILVFSIGCYRKNAPNTACSQFTTTAPFSMMPSVAGGFATLRTALYGEELGGGVDEHMSI